MTDRTASLRRRDVWSEGAANVPPERLTMPAKNARETLSPEQSQELLETLRVRFVKNPHRHPNLKWEEVQSRFEGDAQKLWSLHEMERTGGEPDVVRLDPKSPALVFCDCSRESPQGRRSLCYDQSALESRKANKPEGSAKGRAAAMGIELLTEEQYQVLQSLEQFDQKTSSWVQTPEAVRKLGGALFGDYRFGRVFIYHNGAESYYAARGFRGALKV